jgi:ubiquinone/menaquinone biosynthesis C-methylase UbiE
MVFLGYCVMRLAAVAHWIGGIFERVSVLLMDTLPALLPPNALTQLVRSHYDRSYDNTYARFTAVQQEWPLESWEQNVLSRHRILSGTILVLGTGTGRDSVALAKKGFHVIGLDISRSALHMAVHMARTAGVSVMFVQADFLALPARPAPFDYILLPSIMYSSIPSRNWRQAWLRQLIGLLSQNGLAILQFLVESGPSTRRKRISATINRWLIRLPGTNRLYQTGDSCPQNHFLHAFQHEQELREELSETGVMIREFNWHERYVVIGAMPQAGRN